MQALNQMRSRLLTHALAACAQQPLDVPCRMLTTGRCAAVGRWDSMWELFETRPAEGVKEKKGPKATPQEGETPESTQAASSEAPETQAAGDPGSNQSQLAAAGLKVDREATASPEEGMKPRGDASGQGLTEEDLTEAERLELELDARAACDDLIQHLEGKYFPEEEVQNLAGPGRPAWARLAYNDATEEGLWELDLTGGKVPDNEKNAHLSRDAKNVMLEMAMEGCSIPEIAEFFRVREQRVMAILTLLTIEAEQELAGAKMFEELADVMEGGQGDTEDNSELGYFDCDEVVGSGERHVKIMRRSPYLEAKMKERDPDFNWEKWEDEIAVHEEKHLVQEFRDRLLFNMGALGSSIKRNITLLHRPKRPKDGYSLLVKPLGRTNEKMYVADRAGNQRPLNEDESFLQYKRRVRKRRRLHP